MLEKQVWTNESVKRLVDESPGADPIRIITDKTRRIALEAIDNGWAGPPFDPIRLAERLGIAVQANHSIVDARTVPVGENSFRIEFNPNASPSRVRFSVAHELAHTVFPDCAKEVRHRMSRSGKVGDAWELETLCNIGAAELLMPLGQLGDVAGSAFTIDRVVQLQMRLDVSTEAILLRLIHLTDVPAAAFAASYIESGDSAGRYRLDYAIVSRGWTGAKLHAGEILPNKTALADCTAIGFTSKGEERWALGRNQLHIECVGIPPYPWGRLPRVAGVALERREPDETVPVYKVVRGDALQPRGEPPHLIVHIVNNKARSWGGGGFAQAIRGRWPAVHDEFRELAGDSTNLQLGKVHYHHAADDVWIADMVAQVGYGPTTQGPRVRYAFLRQCLDNVAGKAKELGASVHMPRIGAGNAGGSWPVIEELIQTTLCENNVPVTVYDLPPRELDDPSQLALV